MNVFVLDDDPKEAAIQQCDKHVPKMVVESGQMLSTVHRMLDGIEERRKSKSGKTMVKYWRLPDAREEFFYKAVHMNHPCTVWSRQTSDNYIWHYKHFVALCDEYTYRFGKLHRTDALLRAGLERLPDGINKSSMTPFPLAMKSNPECMFPEDPVKSYKLFYQTKQSRFKMAWARGRQRPEWFAVA